jgi:hypothetical protein
MANTRLTRTLGTATNRKKFTISTWFKLGTSPVEQYLFSAGSGTSFSKIGFNGSGYILIFQKNSDTKVAEFSSNALLRDPASWYNLVVAYDTTLATAADRQKVYLNGIQQTSFDTTNPPINTEFTGFNNNIEHKIGTSYDNSSYFNGSMSHFHFIDGTAYDASAFGETDATTGEWKIKTSPSVTYGTNGFFIIKDGNSVTDQSGNSNNFTVANGNFKKTEDNPSNNFATFNPLYRTGATNFAYGNTYSQSPTQNGFGGISTLAASNGKYYAEFKLQNGSTSYEACVAVMVGSSISNTALFDSYPEYTVGSYGIRQGDASSGNAFWTTGAGGRTSGANHGGFSIGDTIGIALDIDNNKVYFSKNGQWNNSGSWNSATPSTYLTLISTYGDGQYFFVTGDSSNGNDATWSVNFGNGYQKTTAVSSAGTNASGNGIFEYDVPTGYTALSTKGLNL